MRDRIDASEFIFTFMARRQGQIHAMHTFGVSLSRRPCGWTGRLAPHLYLIEYGLISNDQLPGSSLPVPGSGIRNPFVHSAR